MHDKQDSPWGWVQQKLPWLVAGAALLVYLLTLNRWVSLASLPLVAKVTGWDWTPAVQSPLFIVLTFPIRWLPAAWEPVALNVFSALCAALALAQLVRSVALLPHDRTLEQRHRERSEFSRLTIRAAWLPPLFAALVCGLQLTMWEHATAATGEALDLLLFAYLIRCLLEFRLDHRESWLTRLAFIYGLGVTNNWALIGFFPLFLIALVWIKGFNFFELRFLARMAGFGILGLLLYLLLPLVWIFSEGTQLTFLDVLRSNLATQKAFLINIPALRSRALLLSLTSVLPVFIMGIRWPSSFGDTSVAGALLTNFMFRLIHIVFLTFCLYVAFDQGFSPRRLGLGLPFLPFYYLGALSVGYYCGYVLLIFGEAERKTWQRRSAARNLVNSVLRWAVAVALIAVPAGLVYRNLSQVRIHDGAMLKQFCQLCAQHLPAKGTTILSDDPVGLLLLEAYLDGAGASENHLFVNTRLLEFPAYHERLLKRFPQQWPDLLAGEEVGERIEQLHILQLVSDLVRTNTVYYLQPSFGYFFERVYQQSHGLVYELKTYPTNSIFRPALAASEIEENQAFWSRNKAGLDRLQGLSQEEYNDAHYVADYYSRAANFWGVELQRDGRLEEAGQYFQLAGSLNTNNVLALANLAFNKSLREGRPRVAEATKSLEDRFGRYRSWETVLRDNGPVDEPDFAFRLGQVLAQQSLFRQAMILLGRAQKLDPDNFQIRLALANVYLFAQLPDRLLQAITDIESHFSAKPLTVTNQIELIRLEAGAYFAKTNFDQAEKVLLAAQAKHPQDLALLESLFEMYSAAGRTSNALAVLDQQLQVAPNATRVLLQKADVYITAKDHGPAFAQLDQVLKLEPDNVTARLYKVFVHIQNKEYPKALPELDRILKTDPENVQALTYRGVAYLETKAYDQALLALDEVLKLEPGNLAALRNRAIANLQNNRLPAALKDYETLRKHMPRTHAVYYGLGEIAYRRKETQAAVKNYELYLKYAPAEGSPEQKEEKQLVTNRLKELKAAAR
ncbi:MAG: tetratricopeptide repeat protein [Verrucomicrobiota bacterium]